MRNFRTHKKRKGKKLIVFLITMLFVVYLALPALAQTIQELEQQKEISQAKLNLIQFEVDQKQKTINGIENEILRSNEAIGSIQTEISVLNTEIEELNVQIEQKEKELEEAEIAEREQNEAIENRLRVQYMYGNDGYTEALFSGDSITQQLENSEIIKDILVADQDLLNQIIETKNTIAQTKATLENQRVQYNSKKAQLDENLKKQNEIKQQQQTLLNNNIDLLNQRKAEMLEEETQISQANEKILQLTKEAEEKAKKEARARVQENNTKAQSLQSTISTSSEEIRESSVEITSPEIEELNTEIENLVEETAAQQEKLDELVKEVETAETAADIVKLNEDIEYIITIIEDNNATIQNLAINVREIQVEIKEEEIKQAQEASETEVLARAIEEQEALQQEIDNYYEEETYEEPVEESSEPSWEYDNISITGWRWPLDGNHDITSLYGYRIHPIFGVGRGHEGVDIGASSGTPIHACDGGTVISAGPNGGYGNCVIIQQDSGHQVYYAHQSEIAVSYGQRVEKGDVIGYVGSTGWSTGPHLHLGVVSGGSFIDPFTYFPELN